MLSEFSRDTGILVLYTEVSCKVGHVISTCNVQDLCSFVGSQDSVVPRNFRLLVNEGARPQILSLDNVQQTLKNAGFGTYHTSVVDSYGITRASTGKHVYRFAILGCLAIVWEIE